MSYGRVVSLAICIGLFVNIEAKAQEKCGFDRLISNVLQVNGEYSDSIEQIKYNTNSNSRSLQKVSNSEVTIPVVFHIVLNKAQLTSLGGEVGIQARIDSQLAVVNRDFNTENQDVANVPKVFKPLVGKTNIRFALAHTKPDGTATPGYQIIETSKSGMNVEGGTGSGFGFSEAKYTSSSGIESWDVFSYLNVWVVNPLDNGRASNILGLAIPPYLANDFSSVPTIERGLVLHYRAFGKRTLLGQQYIAGSDSGRTMTHELGHFFNLFHVWGDDEGYCPTNGGADDGIDDTPPQGYPSRNCPTFPQYDACSRIGTNGIMFMNFMDYTDDRCVHMFTQQQAARMQQSVLPGNNAYSLTQHPWLLSYPDSNSAIVNTEPLIYPNPADNVVNIVFREQPSNFEGITLIDVMGRVVKKESYSIQSLYYSVHTSSMHAGIYFLVLRFKGNELVKKVLVR